MFDIRLRRYDANGVRGRTINAQTIAFTDERSAWSTLRFTTSTRQAAYLPSPTILAVEWYDDANARWVEVPNGRIIAIEDSSDVNDEAGIVTYVGVNYVGWLIMHAYLGWSASVRNGERKWTQRNAGYIFAGMLLEAKNRGWGTYLTYDFTQTHDSNGVAWPTADRIDAEYRIGVMLDKVLDALTNAGLCEVWTEGMTLKMGVPGTGVDRTNPGGVVLGNGSESRPVRRSSSHIFTHLVVIPEKSKFWLYLNNPGATTEHGRLEAVQTMSGVEDHPTATRLAQATLIDGRASREQKSMTYKVGNAKNLPWKHYRCGDRILAKFRGGKEALRVTELVVSRDAKGVVTASTVLDHRFKSITARLAGAQSKATLGSVSGGTTGAPLPPASPPPNPQPAPPSGLMLLENEGYFGEGGVPRSLVRLEWNPVTMATDGAEVDIVQYELWSETAGQNRRLTASEQRNARLEELIPEQPVTFRVRALSVGDVWSEFSLPLVVTPALPLVVPNRPTSPVLSVDSAIVSARWDGELLDGVTPGPPPLGHDYVYATWSETPSGTQTRFGSPLNGAGSILLLDRPVGSTVWVRFYAVNKIGVTSPPSSAIQITVTSAILEELEGIQEGVEEALENAALAQMTADGRNRIFVDSVAPGGVDAVRRNIAPDPLGTDPARFETNAVGTLESVPGFGGHATAMEWTRTATGAGRLSVRLPAMEANTEYSVRIPVRASTVFTGVVARFRPNITVGTGETVLGTISIPAGESEIVLTGTTGASGWGASTGFTLVINAATPAIGSKLAMTAILVEAAAEAGRFFYGGMPAAPGRAYVWELGTPNNSPSLEVISDFTQGDQWWVTDPAEPTRVIGVRVWNGGAWVDYLIVADSILVPGSAGTISIGDGTITAPKIVASEEMWAKVLGAHLIKADEIDVGQVRSQHLTVGARPAQGETNQRVPAPMTDADYWAKVIDGTIALVPFSAGIGFTAATAGGLVMTPPSGAFANMPITSRMPVPESRKIHLAGVATSAGTLFVVRFVNADNSSSTLTGIPMTLTGTTATLPDTAVQYQVELRRAAGTAAVTITSARVFEVIGSGPGGPAYVEISPLGFRSVGEGGGQIVDLTANADNFLSLTKWNGVEYEAQTTFDKNGGGQMQRLAVNEDITVRGTRLVGDFASIYRNGALDDGPIIDRKASGALTYGYFRQDSITGLNQAYRALASMEFDVVAGRTYVLTIDSNMSAWNASGGSSTAALEVLISENPIAVNATSGYDTLLLQTWSASTPEIRGALSMNRVMGVRNGIPDKLRFKAGKNYILIRTRTTGGGSININDGGNPFHMIAILDEGPSADGLLIFTDNASSGSGGGSVPTTPPSTPRTIQRVASWSRSYRNGGNNPVTGSGAYDNANMLYRGYGNSPMGAIWGFPALGLAGKTILNAQIYLRNRHTSRNDGIAVNMEVHNLTSPPGTFTAGGGSWLVNWGRGVGAWVELPTGWRSGFASGAFRGLYMGVSGDGSNYGYWDGLGAEDAPQIRLTYI